MESHLKKASYARLPERLRAASEALVKAEREDEFGVEDRLKVIRELLGQRNLGRLADFGGHTGYFSMSLIELGMATAATVYDVNESALSAGRAMAAELGITGKVEHVLQPIDLDFVRQVPRVDTVLCLNLIHHAGSMFDDEIVQARGWDAYAADWLKVLRSKCDLAIVSVGFKGRSKPRYWATPRALRAHRFSALAREAGWRIVYDANVAEIDTLGVTRADGRYSGNRVLALLRARWQIFKSSFVRRVRGRFDKREHYHLYILESPETRTSASH